MYNPQLTHHIQLDILKRMLPKETLRYSEIKPKNVEANLFIYHLKQLFKEGLIEKKPGGYGLTRVGKHFTDRANLETMKIRVQPKIVIILAIEREDGQWLMLDRNHQPFVGYKGLPSGKIHYGETLQVAAVRELEEKSGLKDVDLELRGNVIMRFLDGDDPVNHVSGYIFYGKIPRATEVNFSTDLFSSRFASEADMFTMPCFKGHEELLKLVKAGKRPFLEELNFESDY